MLQDQHLSRHFFKIELVTTAWNKITADCIHLKSFYGKQYSAENVIFFY